MIVWLKVGSIAQSLLCQQNEMTKSTVYFINRIRSLDMLWNAALQITIINIIIERIFFRLVVSIPKYTVFHTVFIHNDDLIYPRQLQTFQKNCQIFVCSFSVLCAPALIKKEQNWKAASDESWNKTKCTHNKRISIPYAELTYSECGHDVSIPNPNGMSLSNFDAKWTRRRNWMGNNSKKMRLQRIYVCSSIRFVSVCFFCSASLSSSRPTE